MFGFPFFYYNCDLYFDEIVIIKIIPQWRFALGASGGLKSPHSRQNIFVELEEMDKHILSPVDTEEKNGALSRLWRTTTFGGSTLVLLVFSPDFFKIG